MSAVDIIIAKIKNFTNHCPVARIVKLLEIYNYMLQKGIEGLTVGSILFSLAPSYLVLPTGKHSYHLYIFSVIFYICVRQYKCMSRLSYYSNVHLKA